MAVGAISSLYFKVFKLAGLPPNPLLWTRHDTILA
eukprot:SAG11_NODE_29210_length_313_cov_0.967290_1_plen_34_part_01